MRYSHLLEYTAAIKMIELDTYKPLCVCMHAHVRVLRDRCSIIDNYKMFQTNNGCILFTHTCME